MIQHWKRRPVEQRFWERVQKSGGCWIWRGPFMKNGYGSIGMGGREGRREYAHRLSWILANGPIVDGLYVLHRCDVKACVRPDHLFLGTHADNMRDKALKGLAVVASCENSPNAKFTNAQVLAIRQRAAEGAMYKTLALQHRVHPSVISRIVNRKTWRKLDGQGTSL